MASMPVQLPAAPAPAGASPTFSFDPAPPQGAPAPAAPAPDATPAPAAEWFIQSPTGTKYRTAADAVAGIAEKDQTITRYKQQVEDMQRIMGGNGAPQAPAAPSVLDVLEQSVTQNRPEVFQQYFDQTVSQAAQRMIDAKFGPMQPLLQHAGLERAAELATAGPNGDPNIPAFTRSQAFKSMAEKFPVLGAAINNASVNPEYATQQLPEILQIAYIVARSGASAVPATATPQHATPPSSSSPAQTFVQNPAAPTRERWADNDPRRMTSWDSISAADWAAANGQR